MQMRISLHTFHLTLKVNVTPYVSSVFAGRKSKNSRFLDFFLCTYVSGFTWWSLYSRGACSPY